MKKFVFLFITVLVPFILNGGQANAEPTLPGSENNNQIFTTTFLFASNTSLHVPESWLAVTYPGTPTSHQVQIYDGVFCTAPTGGTGANRSDPIDTAWSSTYANTMAKCHSSSPTNRINYDFCNKPWVDVSQLPSGLFCNQHSSMGMAYLNWSSMTIPAQSFTYDSERDISTTYVHTTYVNPTADILDPAYIQGRNNAFRLWASDTGGDVGFVGQGLGEYKAAIQNRDPGESNSTHNDNFTIRFGSDCNSNPAVRTALQWYDADRHGYTGAYDPPGQRDSIPPRPDDEDIKFKLIDVTLGGAIVPLYKNSTLNNIVSDAGGYIDNPEILGANGLNLHRVFFNPQPDHKYKWIWESVEGDNGVNLVSPFSGSNYAYRCTPPEPVRCSNPQVSINPGFPEVGEPFSAKLGFSYPDPGKTYSITNINLGGLAGSKPDTLGTTVSGNNYYTLPNLSGSAAGNYTISYRVAVTGATAINCSDQITIIAKPYVKVDGNDILAGGAFSDAPTCTPVDDQAGVFAFKTEQNVNNNLQQLGASSQFAVVSLGTTQGLFSAGRNSPALYVPDSVRATPVVDLTFGNYNSSGANSIAPQDTTKVAPNRAGNSGISRCVPDYFKKHPATVTSGSVNLAQDGVSYYQGDQNITDPNGATYSKQKVIFVDGDVTISTNIRFTGSWASVAQIPSLWIIARGNIYVDRGVSRIDGVYVAQPDTNGDGGGIITCGVYPLGAVSGNDLYSLCNNKLTIGGAFIADHVKLLRGFGSLRLSNPNESASVAPAAEAFIGGPELYLSTLPAILQTSGGCNNSNCRYDSITSLPPTL